VSLDLATTECAVGLVESTKIRIVGSLPQYSFSHCPATSYHTSPHLSSRTTLKPGLKTRRVYILRLKNNKVKMTKESKSSEKEFILRII
jgi:hypothetical protein